MIGDWLQQQKTLSPQEIKKGQEEFIGLTFGEREDLWKKLHAYFAQTPVSADRRFWYSYFRWYTHLTWQFFRSKEEEVLSTVAFPRQLVMALLLDFDPLRELVTYAEVMPFTEETLPQFYTKLRDNTLKSTAVIGIAKGRELTYADIIREITVINQNKDSLRMAEFVSRLRDLLFPKNDALLNEYVLADQDTAVSRFMDVLSFLIGVTPDTIWPVIQDELYPQTAAPQDAAAPKAETFARPAIRPASSGAPITAQAQGETTVEPVTAVLSETATPSPAAGRPSNQEIRKMVEAVFPPSSDSETQLPQIVEMLNALAVRYGDDAIRDLYYFDSTTNRFEWAV